MGLAVEAVADSLAFIRKYPSALFFSAIILGITFATVFVTVFGFVFSLVSISSSSLLGMTGMIALLFIIIVVVSAIEVGGFPLLVQQAVRQKKVDTFAAIKGAASRIVSLLAALVLRLLILLVIMIPIILLAVMSWISVFTLIGSMSTGTSSALYPPTTSRLSAISPLMDFLPALMGLSAISLIASIYVSLRLFYTFPIIMLEKKGAIDALKMSWHQTKGKLLSIFGAALLLGLIYLIGDLIIRLIFTLGGPVGRIVGLLVSGIIFGTILGVFPTVYYLNAKGKK